MAWLGTKDDPKGQKGAVMVEFIIAAIPILMMLFTFTQASLAYTANLLLRHAAITGARSAAVILPPNPGNVGTEADIDKAVHRSLGPFDQTFASMKITKTPASGQYELVTVEIDAAYKCQVPMGGRLMCGLDGLMDMKHIVAQYPNQGAKYQP